MTGTELLNRLVDDIKKVIQAKSITRSHAQLMADMSTYARNPNFEFNHSIEESWISLTSDISFPSDLAVFTQVINYFEPIIDYSKEDKINLEVFLQQLESNKQKVAGVFQKIKDNENLVFISGQQIEPLFNILKERLDYIHADASSVNNCYQSLMQKRKEQ